eukprot:gene7531-10260_t
MLKSNSIVLSHINHNIISVSIKRHTIHRSYLTEKLVSRWSTNCTTSKKITVSNSTNKYTSLAFPGFSRNFASIPINTSSLRSEQLNTNFEVGNENESEPTPADDSEAALSDNAAPNSNMNSSANTLRPKMRVHNIISNLPPKKFTISESSSISEAITHLVTQKLGSSLAINHETGEISGIFTARDVLRYLHQKSIEIPSNYNNNNRTSPSESVLGDTITSIMTKREKLVYCSPSDTVRRCREIMFQLKIRNMPVIDDGTVVGIITMKDLADSAFSLSEIGGKKGFIHNVTGRKGLPTGTKANQNNMSSVPAGRVQLRLDMKISAYSLPHPFKRQDGVAGNRRLYGADKLNDDNTLCEDAHFAIRVHGKGAFGNSSDNSNKIGSSSASSYVYICVADGVGSWRQYGVDPRQYSHRLVENAQKIIESAVWHKELVGDSLFERDQDPIHPLDAIIDAWNLTTNDCVNGSSTICIATLDKKLNQLSYSNVGDCGLMVVRHIDSETAGYMRERQLPRHLRKNDFRIAYLSQQQLKSFNLPYQLGFSNIPEFTGAFETPSDADTASIPVMPGDIIVLATDGLYDNLDLDEIVHEISNWESESLSQPHLSNCLDNLSKRLVLKAREYSLMKERDSPFAILAKENDIMWGGGMPDDTTVIVARIVEANDSG